MEVDIEQEMRYRRGFGRPSHDGYENHGTHVAGLEKIDGGAANDLVNYGHQEGSGEGDSEDAFGGRGRAGRVKGSEEIGEWIPEIGEVAL